VRRISDRPHQKTAVSALSVQQFSFQQQFEHHLPEWDMAVGLASGGSFCEENKLWYRLF